MMRSDPSIWILCITQLMVGIFVNNKRGSPKELPRYRLVKDRWPKPSAPMVERR